MEPDGKTTIASTALGLVSAFLAWILVTALAHAALYLLDAFRGLSDNLLQDLFRQWFTPGLGGYLALQFVNSYLPRASLRWVGIGLCVPVVAFFFFFSLYLIVFLSADYTFSWREQIINWGMSFATCIGVYLSYVHINGESS